ncbi:ZIP zinc transporter-domain-containing protein [Scheffersomyces xylosifermentans]|uniref:ZIP zinc transporter-domain-containing protein n=1 Tax=Scheffersomyces xylosifermentans TaxID=1304137 RepID=UPI00315D51CA
MGASTTLELILLVLLMGITSFCGGMVPLKLSLSPSRLHSVSVFSMGILIGTSLVLVIPEGVETLYGAMDNKDPRTISRVIGFSLLGGFALMYTLDHLPAILLYFNIKFAPVIILDPTAPITPCIAINSVVRSSLTSGLILHSLTDGVSLGSSFVKGDFTIELVFFLAIIVHKLPTAFSLTTILMKEGHSSKIILMHLLLFSLSSPLASIITYGIIKLTDSDNEKVVGILFLFSAGTFLYVVNHVMSEIVGSGEESKKEFTAVPTSADSQETIIHSHSHSSIDGPGVLLVLAGMTIPSLLSAIGEA